MTYKKLPLKVVIEKSEFDDCIYNAKDLCEFAEWCSENYNKTDSGWWKKKMIKPAPDLYTTSQLQIMWEIETGRRPKP